MNVPYKVANLDCLLLWHALKFDFPCQLFCLRFDTEVGDGTGGQVCGSGAE